MSRNLDPEKARELAAFMSLFNEELIDYQLGLTPVLACDDPLLVDWLVNASMSEGDFLKHIAGAGLRADMDNYPLLRPFLLYLKQKYPSRHEPGNA